MRRGKRNGIVLGLLMPLTVGCVVLATHSSAGATTSSEPAPVGYHAPSGPELSPAAAAADAIKYVQGGAEPGEIILRVARGSFAQARAVLDANEGVAGPSASGNASCFPGFSCTPAEVEQHERERRELEESRAYIVEMTGTAFSPPAGRLRKGETPSAASGEVETVIINAQTGFLEERTIGGQHPNLDSLGPVTELSASISAGASGDAAPAIRIRKRADGTIVGRVSGTTERHILIVLSEGDERESPKDVHTVARTTTNSHSTFEIRGVLPGTYRIKASRGNCRARNVTVKARKTTEITLTCRR